MERIGSGELESVLSCRYLGHGCSTLKTFKVAGGKWIGVERHAADRDQTRVWLRLGMPEGGVFVDLKTGRELGRVGESLDSAGWRSIADGAWCGRPESFFVQTEYGNDPGFGFVNDRGMRNSVVDRASWDGGRFSLRRVFTPDSDPTRWRYLQSLDCAPNGALAMILVGLPEDWRALPPAAMGKLFAEGRFTADFSKRPGPAELYLWSEPGGFKIADRWDWSRLKPEAWLNELRLEFKGEKVRWCVGPPRLDACRTVRS